MDLTDSQFTVDVLVAGSGASGPTVAVTARKAGLDVLVEKEPVDRQKPGFTAVLSNGRRFGNESSAYHDLVPQLEACRGERLGPLEKAPFYAVRISAGIIATFAGLRTDRYARVLNHKAQPIPRLYAVGNDQANVFAGRYPGAGATLGPGMTFGYIVGRHLAETTADEALPTLDAALH